MERKNCKESAAANEFQSCNRCTKNCIEQIDFLKWAIESQNLNILHSAQQQSFVVGKMSVRFHTFLRPACRKKIV